MGLVSSRISRLETRISKLETQHCPVPRIHLTIEGMTCEHCVRAVRNRLADTPGVEVEQVEVGSAVITLDPSTTSIESVEDAIADEGYTAYPAG